MRIIEYFTTENKKYWLDKISQSDWGAGKYLAQLLDENKLKETLGETALVLMLTDEDKLVSFCTFAPLDDIQPTNMSPWVGFAYTFPKYRGNKYIGKLLDYAECLATIMEKEAIYISTDHTGLYEKFGYEFFKSEKTIYGEDSRVYRKVLNIDGSDRDRKIKKGNKYKSVIVTNARRGIDPIAYCGFSCNHCFLGEWCGGCRSVFSCCSFGILFEKGKCPNIVCAKSKELEGCYECNDIENCKVGFYSDDNNDANACKAQALFIKKHGKEQLLKAHDKLHEKYDFQKVQEILRENTDKGIKILEAAFSAKISH